MASDDMKNNAYTEKAKKNRILVWEAIFKKIKFAGDRDQPVPEHILWDNDHPFVHGLLQVYYFMSDRIDVACNQEEIE